MATATRTWRNERSNELPSKTTTAKSSFFLQFLGMGTPMAICCTFILEPNIIFARFMRWIKVKNFNPRISRLCHCVLSISDKLSRARVAQFYARNQNHFSLSKLKTNQREGSLMSSPIREPRAFIVASV